MDTNKIRGAQALIDEARHRGHNIPQLVEAARLLKAELDAAPKVLTTEPVAWMTEDGRLASVTGKENMPSAADKAFCIPLYLAPAAWLTVEEVMDIAKEEVFEWWNGERVFHARLTAAIKAKR